MGRESSAKVISPEQMKRLEVLGTPVLPNGAHSANGDLPQEQHFNGGIPQIDDEPNSPNNGKAADEAAKKALFVNRILAIGAIAVHYHDDSQVKHALSKYITGSSKLKFDADPLTQYFQTFSRYPLLTKEDELELFGKLDEGVETFHAVDLEKLKPSQEQVLVDAAIAYNMIFSSNLRLVVKHASKHFRRRQSMLEPMDVMQEGNIGLDYAINRFNVQKGYKFSTYATWWIKQAVQRAVARQSRMINIPLQEIDELMTTRAAQEDLRAKFRREPTIEEVAEYRKLKVEEIVDNLWHGSRVTNSLSDELSYDSGKELADLVASSHDQEFHEGLNIRDMLERVIEAAKLTDDDELFLSFRYRVYRKKLSGRIVQTTNGTFTYDEVFSSLGNDRIVSIKRMSALFGYNPHAAKVLDESLLAKLQLNAEI